MCRVGSGWWAGLVSLRSLRTLPKARERALKPLCLRKDGSIPNLMSGFRLRRVGRRLR